MIDNKKPDSHITSEAARKALHLGFILIPVAYYFLSKEFMFNIVCIMTILLLIIDVGRSFNNNLQVLFYKYCAPLIRKSEMNTVTGASFMMIATVIIIGLFPKIIAITALSVLSISDGVAALIGKYYGRIKLKDKTLEGSIAFLLSGIMIVFIIKVAFNVGMGFVLHGSIAVFIAMIVEFFSKNIKIDDNFSIPLTVAVVLELLTR